MTTCSMCTGSHYLSDIAMLGPCICVTPEALTHAEQTAEKHLNAWRILHAMLPGLARVELAFEEYLSHSLGLDAKPVTIRDQFLAELADSLEAIKLEDADVESLEGTGNRYSRAAAYAVNLNEALSYWVAAFRMHAPEDKVKEADSLFRYIQEGVA